MALPKLNTPTYELELPSTGLPIKYRPFLVKEQKLLLMAQETGEEQDIARAMGELVHSCTFGKIDSKIAALPIVNPVAVITPPDEIVPDTSNAPFISIVVALISISVSDTRSRTPSAL